MHLALFVVWAISIAAMVWGTIYACWQFQQGDHQNYMTPQPPVTIIKPLRGVDPQLYENLESFLNLDYPNYEVIFAIADAADPALEVARTLMAKYPDRDCSIIIGADYTIPNPKVGNMVAAEKDAAHDVILVSDSNVRAYPAYLRSLVPLLYVNPGVVSAPVAGLGGTNFWGRVEVSQINTFYARWAYAAKGARMPFVIGKSMLYRRSVAKTFGGLKSLGSYLAEDYMMGVRMRRIGAPIKIAQLPVLQYIGDRTFKSYWDRHYRWGLLTKRFALGIFLVEPLTFSVVNAALAWAIGGWWGDALVTMTLFAMCDAMLLDTMETDISLPIILLRELLAPLIWVHALFGNTVNWRGRRMKVCAYGSIEHLKPMVRPSRALG